MEMIEDEVSWSTPKPDDKIVVRAKFPNARVKRFPGPHDSWTCYLNRDPNKREMAYFWAPSAEIAWAEARAQVEYELAKASSTPAQHAEAEQ